MMYGFDKYEDIVRSARCLNGRGQSGREENINGSNSRSPGLAAMTDGTIHPAICLSQGVLLVLNCSTQPNPSRLRYHWVSSSLTAKIGRIHHIVTCNMQFFLEL